MNMHAGTPQADPTTARDFLKIINAQAARALNGADRPGLLQLVRIHPADGSAPELRIVYRGQTYQLLALEPVRRHDGQPAVLVEWASCCADCGEPFRFKLSVRARFVPNRRCRLHRRPGVRVRQTSAPVGAVVEGVAACREAELDRYAMAASYDVPLEEIFDDWWTAPAGVLPAREG